MKRKWICLLMFVVMLLGVCACSKGTDGPSKADSKEESSVVLADPEKMDQIMLGVRLGMTSDEVKEKLGNEWTQGENDSICFYDFTILDFRFDRLQYFFEEGKLTSIEYWLEGSGPGNTKIQTRDFSKNVAGVLGEPEESEITLAWFQKWTLDEQTKISVGHNFGETFCIVSIHSGTM